MKSAAEHMPSKQWPWVATTTRLPAGAVGSGMPGTYHTTPPAPTRALLVTVALPAMRIHHVALRTLDLPRLEAFYAGVLGLEITGRTGETSVWLRAGDAIVMLERAAAGEPGVPAGTMEMVAFAITKDQRVECTRRLRAAGIALESETTYTLYVRDPDGRRVGLSHYPA